ncbi:MAG: tRNA preQ1(34) S-adenosylmethionine ribosyltransferase-isomerase QueA [Chloroflexi bacterium]|nr:tRNA preQ1(34) S-adenosylmethionine ribosyltransferase-isomerase QueA [Chloroflexota bacterium]
MTSDDTGNHSSAPLMVADFEFELPEHLIAQQPIEPRDHSRLLVIHRDTGLLEHKHFYDLGSILTAGDVLVINETRVIPARLLGTKRDGGGHVEILLIRPVAGTGEGVEANERMWTALVRPSRRVAANTIVELDAPGAPRVHVGQQYTDGTRLVTLPEGFVLDDVGQVPLPPYIRQEIPNLERYQTIYASKPGSVAAPTAGLHFTPELMESLQEKGVRIARLTLDVGPGTFRPVKVDDPREHVMGEERYELPEEAAETISQALTEGRRVVAVGSTPVRALESIAINQGLSEAADGQRTIDPEIGETELMILPGFQFKVIGAMITNFHLPRSTLLMLAAAFASKELVDSAYREAIAQEYRFYSFGDSMIML